jgi:hypothetical protein
MFNVLDNPNHWKVSLLIKQALLSLFRPHRLFKWAWLEGKQNAGFRQEMGLYPQESPPSPLLLAPWPPSFFFISIFTEALAFSAFPCSFS